MANPGAVGGQRHDAELAGQSHLGGIVAQPDSQEAASIISLLNEISADQFDNKEVLDKIDKITSLSSGLAEDEKEIKTLSIRKPSLPEEIKADVSADVNEVEKCFNSGCYRSATVLCGRIMEAALHRKYYDVTGQDILEKNPGIGLGTLIAKLRDKNVTFDPGITQQIHLINQVRVFSVHKKQEAFNPSKEQAHAIILYTLDVLGKMWDK